MDQKFRTAGGSISGVIIIVCGIIILPLAIGLIFAWPSKFSWASLLFVPLAIWMIYAGFKAIRSSINELKESDLKQQKVRNIITSTEKTSPVAVSQSKSSTNEKIILAHWKYPIKDWQFFMNLEKKDRKMDLWIEIIIISLFGAFLIKISKNESWLIGFTFSIPIALIIGLLRYKLNISSLLLSGQKEAEVIFTSEAVIVNNRYNRLTGDNLWLGNVLIKKFKGIDVLEISYCWNTRKGDVSEVMRIPIPAGKIPEANEVMNSLLKTKR